MPSRSADTECAPDEVVAGVNSPPILVVGNGRSAQSAQVDAQRAAEQALEEAQLSDPNSPANAVNCGSCMRDYGWEPFSMKCKRSVKREGTSGGSGVSMPSLPIPIPVVGEVVVTSPVNVMRLTDTWWGPVYAAFLQVQSNDRMKFRVKCSCPW